MPRIFSTVVKRTTVQNILPPPIIVSSGEVTQDRIVAENLNRGDKAVEAAMPVIAAAEANRDANESVTAAVLGQATETAKRAVEDISNDVIARAAETAKRATDAQAVAVAALDAAKRAADRLSLTVAPTPDVAKRAAETTPLMVTATAAELGRRQVDQVQAAIVALRDQAKRAAESVNLVVTLAGYANANTSTGWTNPGNAQGNTTGTAATLTATASGVAGTTNNTTTGTLTLDFQDVNLGDLTIGTVVVNVETEGATAGVAVAQPTTSIQWQYSLDGVNFTTFYTMSTPTVAKGIRSADITALVGQDQAKLSALKIRATGSVTSGTGLGTGNTASFYRAWMTVSASRVYA